jgi:hypothetical protein
VTIQAKSAGWYRACVRGTWYQVRSDRQRTTILPK